MSVVLEIVGVLGDVIESSEMPKRRAFLLRADVEAYHGGGACEWTENIAEAKRFPDMESALAFWKQQSRIRPLREDGLPNRPLTAFTVCPLPVGDENGESA